MDLQNFRFDLDPDGIATATWHMPCRSMNVITPEVMAELSQIVEKVASDDAIKGCVPRSKTRDRKRCCSRKRPAADWAAQS